MIRKEVMTLAVLKCTECGHDVSTFAERCPNCGCPISVIVQNRNCASNEKKYDVILESYAVENKPMLMRFIKESSGGKLSLTDALNIMKSLPKEIIIGVDKDVAENVVNKIKALDSNAFIRECTDGHEPSSSQNIKASFLFTKDEPLKCPHCGSTAITTTSRGYSLMWGFTGSNKTVNRCGKCGYTWKP